MIGLLPMRFLSPQFVATRSILVLVPIVAGTLVGAWLYPRVTRFGSFSRAMIPRWSAGHSA